LQIMKLFFSMAATCLVLTLSAQKQRAREFGIPFEGTPGAFNAITDVPGVEVGYKTKISGKYNPHTAEKPVRTGVTVILPQGKTASAVPAGWFCLNGDGEMTGTTVIDEYGMLYGPIGITNTNSVGVVRDGIGAWNVKNFSEGGPFDFSFGLPVAAETFDGMLNDINGFHIKQEDVFEALDGAKSGPVDEGNVGGGTGMSLFLYKGGSGTSSRVVQIGPENTYRVGVFVQGNFGGREDLTVAGVPVGKEMAKEAMPILNFRKKDGSIIIVVATDAPMLPMMLKSIAKRASLGVARTGGLARNSSGDIFIAFSTKTPETRADGLMQSWNTIPKEQMDKFYKATVQATEEAILNALLAAETMDGIDGNTFYEIPKKRLKEVMQKYNRLKK
jgi:D-aminopeptidase